MSDSTAFLAGAAFAGVATVLLIRGGEPTQSFQVAQPLPPPPIQPVPNTPLPVPISEPPSSGLEQYVREMERLKAQVDQQKNDTDLLKEQLRSQQLVIDSLRSQSQIHALNPQSQPASALVATQQPENQIFSGVLWAVGGIIFTVTLGIILAAVFAVLSQHQRSPRVQVIQPFDPEASLPSSRRRSVYLPPRSKSRRSEPVDYERD